MTKKNKRNELLSELFALINAGNKGREIKKVVCSDVVFENVVLPEIMGTNTCKATEFVITYNRSTKRFGIEATSVTMKDSRTIDVAARQDCDVLVGNEIKTVKDYTFSSISIKMCEDSTRLIGNEVFGSTIAVVNSENGYLRLFVERTNVFGSVYFDILTGSTMKELPALEGSIVRRYALDPVTASGSRNKSGTFRLKTNGSDTRFEVFNNATSGGMQIAKDKAEKLLANVTSQEELEGVRKQLKKDYGYLGNVGTGCVNLGLVTSYVVYEGKWLNNTPEFFSTEDYLDLLEELNRLKVMGANEEAINSVIEKMAKLQEEQSTLDDVSTQDGQAYVDAVELAIHIFEKTGYVVDPWVLIGRMLQFRPATIKASAIVVHPTVMDRLVEGTKALAADRGEEVNTHGKDKATRRPLFIADRNCVKLDFDYETDVELSVLAFNKSSEGQASKQMYKNILMAAHNQNRYYEILDLIGELEYITVDNAIAEAIDTSRPAKMVTPTEILAAMKSGYNTNVVNAIAPKFARESKPHVQSTWKQSVDKVVNCIDRMHGALKVASRRLASDPTFIITGGKLNGILRLGYSFINDASIKKSVMFKYPVAGLEEQYPSLNVGKKQIIDAANKHYKKGTITLEECDAIILFFSSLKKTVRVLPALMFLANACAGLDFDYDGESSMIYTENPTTREEEITNLFVDVLFENGIRGVSIRI